MSEPKRQSDIDPDGKYFIKLNEETHQPEVYSRNYNKTGKIGLIMPIIKKGAKGTVSVCYRLAGYGVKSVGWLVMVLLKGIKPRTPDQEVMHKNGDASDNSPKNLWWGPKSEKTDKANGKK